MINMDMRHLKMGELEQEALVDKALEALAVALADLKETMPSYDGWKFWESYRQTAK